MPNWFSHWNEWIDGCPPWMIDGENKFISEKDYNIFIPSDKEINMLMIDGENKDE